MSTCSIVNKETKEPIKYYRSDNGKIFTHHYLKLLKIRQYPMI